MSKAKFVPGPEYDGASPGNKYIYRGIEYIAVEDVRNDCEDCAFDNLQDSCGHAPAGCGQHGTIWLTSLNAITHRLTT